MIAPVCFVDCETTGLDPDRHEIWEVALLGPTGQESAWILDVDLGRADPRALEIGRFHDRHPRGHFKTLDDEWMITDHATFAADFARRTRGLHLAGAVVSFDEERLRKLLRANGACPEWNYHLVDVEALAAGKAGLAPPWKSDDLSRSVGINPGEFARHTALGDARWARAIYNAVIRPDQ